MANRGTDVGEYVQDAVTQILLLRPEDPIAYLAEYFRAASSLESVHSFSSLTISNGAILHPSPSGSSPSNANAPLHLTHSNIGGIPSVPSTSSLPSSCSVTSTPLSRAIFLITTVDIRCQPTLFDTQISYAYDELTGTSDSLLGSALLVRPSPLSSHGRSSSTVNSIPINRTVGHTGVGGTSQRVIKGIAPASASTLTQSGQRDGMGDSRIDVDDLRAIIHHLLHRYPSTHSGTDMPIDLIDRLQNSILGEAISSSSLSMSSNSPSLSHRSARGNGAGNSTYASSLSSSHTFVNFRSFRHAVRDACKMALLYNQLLTSLLKFPSSPLSSSSSSSAPSVVSFSSSPSSRLDRVVDSTLTSFDVIQFLRLLSTHIESIEFDHIQTIVSGLKFHSSTFDPTARVSIFTLMTEIIQTQLHAIHNRRRLERDDANKRASGKELNCDHISVNVPPSSIVSSSSSQSLLSPTLPIDTDLPTIYASPFHTNPLTLESRSEWEENEIVTFS